MSASIRARAFAYGGALLRAHRVQDAIDTLHAALSEIGNTPDDLTIVLALSDACRQSTRPEQSIRLLVTYAESHDRDRDRLLRHAADAFQRQWAPELVPLLETDWRWLLSLDSDPAPATVTALLLAADIYAAAQHHGKALDLLTRARRAATNDHDRSRVAAGLYGVANALNNADDLASAAEFLNEAIGTDPSHSRSIWLLAEVLRRQSYPENTPELKNQGLAVGERFVRDSLRVWNTPQPAAEAIESWALCSRGLMNEQLAKLPGADRWALGWEAIAYIQRALHARGYDSVFDCSTLARCYRAMNLNACEDELSRRALTIATTDSQKLSASVERIITTVNAGKFDAAVDLLQAQPASAWKSAVDAFIALRRGMAAQAIASIERAIADDFGEPWCLSLRADCYRDAGDDDRFFEACKGIWSNDGPKTEEVTFTRARAGLWLGLRSGEFAEAAALVDEYEATALPNDSNGRLLAGLIALARGDLKNGTERLGGAIATTFGRRELDDLRRDVRYLSLHHNDPSVRATDAFKELDDIIAARIAAVTAEPRSPEAELGDLLGQRPADDAGGWLRVAAMASLARLDVWASRFESATGRYATLIDSKDNRFPEATGAVQRCANRALAKADAGLRSSKSADGQAASLHTYRWFAEQTVLGSGIRGDAWTALMFAHALTGETDIARSAFQSALQQYGDSQTGSLTKIAARLGVLIHHASELWKVWSAIPRIAPPAVDVAPLQAALFQWFGTAYSAQATTRDVEWLPLILELGDGFIPDDAEQNYEHWALFTTYVPQLREWFANERGFRLKPVRVRGNTGLAPNEYAFHIHEVSVPLARNAVPLDCRYVSAPWAVLVDAGIPTAAVEEESYPIDGRSGFWVKPEGWLQLESARLPYDEPLRFVMNHFTNALRERWHEFVDPDAVEAILLDFSATAPNADFVDDVLPSPAARFHFSRLLRALAEQDVALTNLGEILEAIRGVSLGPASLGAAMKTVRQRLRARLPGNSAAWHRVDVPTEIEQDVQHIVNHTDDGVSAARVDSDIRRLLTRARDEQEVEGIVLTTARYETADYLRSVLRRQFRDVTALSTQELYEPAPATVAAN
jgi:tetratricopeptide (TPR) repeat protein